LENTIIGNELKSLGRQSFDPIVLKSNAKKQNKIAKLNEEKTVVSEIKANPQTEKNNDQPTNTNTQNPNNKTKSKDTATATPANNVAKKPAVARLSFELKSIRIMDEDAANNIAKGKKE